MLKTSIHSFPTSQPFRLLITSSAHRDGPRFKAWSRKMAAKRSFSFDDPPPSRSTQSNLFDGEQVRAGALPDFGAVWMLWSFFCYLVRNETCDCSLVILSLIPSLLRSESHNQTRYIRRWAAVQSIFLMTTRKNGLSASISSTIVEHLTWQVWWCFDLSMPWLCDLYLFLFLLRYGIRWGAGIFWRSSKGATVAQSKSKTSTKCNRKCHGEAWARACCKSGSYGPHVHCFRKASSLLTGQGWRTEFCYSRLGHWIHVQLCFGSTQMLRLHSFGRSWNVSCCAYRACTYCPASRKGESVHGMTRGWTEREIKVHSIELRDCKLRRHERMDCKV